MSTTNVPPSPVPSEPDLTKAKNEAEIKKTEAEARRIEAEIAFVNRKWFNKKNVTPYISALSLLLAVFSLVIAAGTFWVYYADQQQKTNESKLRSNASIVLGAIRTGTDEAAARKAAANLLLLQEAGVLTLTTSLQTRLQGISNNMSPGLPYVESDSSSLNEATK